MCPTYIIVLSLIQRSCSVTFTMLLGQQARTCQQPCLHFTYDNCDNWRVINKEIHEFYYCGNFQAVKKHS